MVYERMADSYDLFMENAPYDKWLQWTEQLLKGREVQCIADVGCGTGEITRRLAQVYPHVVGVDYAVDMLSKAERKCRDTGTSIQWVCQDVRSLNGITGLDAVVSFCDVINYITTEQELALTFQNIYDALSEKGVFLFDVHALSFVMENYINETFADVTEEASYIWFCLAGEHIGEMYHELTFFSKNEKGTYSRFDEVHHQRTFSVDFYKKLLQQKGFQNIKVYGDFSVKANSVDENTARIFFFAEKSE
ncbi:SAM-dependent methyltransferase [Virgibacillus dokdonensis]|uniref:SAM-dependent methyltransferase n=1 Tax=Virgibacillus dokdonensis TaxID=302167 RepID=A0A3E0WW08_9BACI|nr:class I SAM-dependent methyltransferase [Virgibacillus dokdonensis]RFA36351.1 SAM-dependent methyltransferase [Virgibacillus dokdonensis]